MTVSNLKSELTSLLSDFEVPLYDAFSSEKVTADVPIAFLFSPVCKKVDEALNPDGVHSWKKYTYDCRLEITGKGNVSETSFLIFKSLNQSDSYKNVTLSSLSLSKITRLPSVEISFQIVETNNVTFAKKDEDIIFSGLSAKGIIEKTEESDVIFTPSVILATGEKYLGDSVSHGQKITVFVKIYAPLAQSVCNTVLNNLNLQTNISIGDTTYNSVRFEKVETVENNGFTAVLKLGFYI